MESASGGEFRGRFENASHDHADDQVTLWGTRAGEEGFQAEPAKGAEGCDDVAVRRSAHDLEGVGGRNERLALEHASQGVDLSGGPRGEVGERAFDDLAIDAGGLAEEDGGRGVAIGDGLDIHGIILA
jgi:hypothetical protein